MVHLTDWQVCFAQAISRPAEKSQGEETDAVHVPVADFCSDRKLFRQVH